MIVTLIVLSGLRNHENSGSDAKCERGDGGDSPGAELTVEAPGDCDKLFVSTMVTKMVASLVRAAQSER